MRRGSVCDDNDDCQSGSNAGCGLECVCLHTLKHEDESVEGGCIVNVVLYISKALAYISPPPSTSHGV